MANRNVSRAARATVIVPSVLGTRHVAGAAVVATIGLAVWQFGGWVPESAMQAINDIILAVLALVATVFGVLAAQATAGRVRAGWSAMAFGTGAWAVGQVILTYVEVHLGIAPYPSWADLFYLLYPIGAGIALLCFWNRRGSRSLGRVVLDGLIVAGSVFLVSWLVVIHKTYESSHASGMELAVLMAYPAFDSVVLTLATTVLVNANAAQRIPLTVLTLGVACMWMANSVYAYLSLQGGYIDGGLVDMGWTAGMMLFTVAAAAGRTVGSYDTALIELPGWASVWLPYLPLMLAAATLAASPVPLAVSPPTVAVGLTLVVAVLVRQFLVVDQNRRLLSAVADQALHDPLTGLANRALFADRLTAALEDQGSSVAVMVIDLDDFKVVNDTLGHATGDELLIGAGKRITAGVRADDIVARIGGDEFAVLLTGGDTRSQSTAERVVKAFDDPIEVDGHPLLIRPSVGVAVAHPGRQSAPSADEFFKQADVAMYEAKRSRGSQICLFEQPLQGATAGERRRPTPDRRGAGAPDTVRLFGELRRAIEAHELTVVYQPKFVLDTRRMCAAEALLRWPHPERGDLFPDDFLPLVRQYGLHSEVTDFLLERALDDARDWRGAGIDLGVAINIFPPSLQMTELPQRIARALEARGLAPGALTMEITDDLVLGDIEAAQRVLAELRRQGVTVSIDDFGSGYSALWYLRDLPVDEIKLGRHFISQIAVDTRAAAVVHAVIALARALGIATVAEGVEDITTAEMLISYGCDTAQGYYFGAPMSAAEIIALGSI